MGKRSVRAWLAGSCLVAIASVPAVAYAASVPATIAPPASETATTAAGQWALDFTLPTFGKSGCLVCHGDPKLVVPKGGNDVSYWVDEEAYDRSVHARVVCTGCHTDFGYKAPHTNGTAWKTAAKQACVACHDQQTSDFADGAHAVRPTSGGAKDPKAGDKPRCGDCHGDHDIQKLTDNAEGQAQLHAAGKDVCGAKGCHADYWDSYNDSYHGRAYKRGAEDAPACWDCHGAHTVLPAKSLLSPINDANLEQTCAKGAGGGLRCHEGSSDALMSYAKAIHGRDEILASNPIYSLWATVKSWFK